jgi:hypothetical protein
MLLGTFINRRSSFPRSIVACSVVIASSITWCCSPASADWIRPVQLAPADALLLTLDDAYLPPKSLFGSVSSDVFGCGASTLCKVPINKPASNESPPPTEPPDPLPFEMPLFTLGAAGSRSGAGAGSGPSWDVARSISSSAILCRISALSPTLLVGFLEAFQAPGCPPTLPNELLRPPQSPAILAFVVA